MSEACQEAFDAYVERNYTGNPHEGFGPEDFEAGWEAAWENANGMISDLGVAYRQSIDAWKEKVSALQKQLEWTKQQEAGVRDDSVNLERERDAALSALRADVLEEAAQKAEEWEHDDPDCATCEDVREIVAAIRDLRNEGQA